MDEDSEQRRAEGELLQAELPEGSNAQPGRDDDSRVQVALLLAEFGLVGIALGLSSLVLRRLFRRRA